MVLKNERKVKYYLNDAGEFTIENYDKSKMFSSFFPGIAGTWGIPMWIFYVNRGQGICSMGIKNKDQSIMEFYPANNAYRLVQLYGFRTFIKIMYKNSTMYYEPFNGIAHLNGGNKKTMTLDSNKLMLEEINLHLGLKISVKYFSIPNDNFAALARELRIENLNKKSIKIEVLDGLGVIMPYGMNGFLMKSMSRTIEAWMEVLNLENKAPYYKLKVDPADRPEIEHIRAGNFYFGFYPKANKTVLLEPIADADIIFGQENDLKMPLGFLNQDKFRVPKVQNASNKTPSAMGFASLELKGGESMPIYSFVGHIGSVEKLNENISRIANEKYFSDKEHESGVLISNIKDRIFTASNFKNYDMYAQQTFLDNALRGGYPYTVETSSGKKNVLYLYSRKHGDLERDYNNFQLNPTYFSQGNGSYRDMCQNRRNDVFFNPDCYDMNIINFYNLVQLDGFNPLVIKSAVLVFRDEKLEDFLSKHVLHDKDRESLENILSKHFVIGDVLLFIEHNDVKLKVTRDEFFKSILENSECYKDAEHGEGFWIDHWTYPLDLLESYLMVYPEKLNEVLFEKKCFTFYDNHYTVRPRSEKYVLMGEDKVRQFNSISKCHHKDVLISSRSNHPYKVRDNNGKGNIYSTSLLVKMLSIVVNKMASLDPFGIGIEMEADKPSWYDSLNGLPGLIASSSSETFELLRTAKFLLSSFEKAKVNSNVAIAFPREIYEFIQSVSNELKRYFDDKSQEKDFNYWDNVNTIKEKYRQTVRDGLVGFEMGLTVENLTSFLNMCVKKLSFGIEKSYDKKTGLYHTYFVNEAVEFEFIYEQDKSGASTKKLSHRDRLPCVRVKKFKQKPLPHFLESQVHAMKIFGKSSKAKRLYESVKSSNLYDKKLKMYKLNMSLAKESEEIGRTKFFMPSWLENESIWLHMEYKYLLEILRCGFYDEFYEEFFNVLIPFNPPDRYGRSILENSSFLVSSEFEDKNLWGNGFVARLSGSTAEFLHIWLLLNIGESAFNMDAGNRLSLEFDPILSKDMFTRKKSKYEYFNNSGIVKRVELDKNEFAFLFLSDVLVVYHNPKRKNTFGKDAVKPKQIQFQDVNDKKIIIDGNVVGAPYAQQIRERNIKRVDVYLG